MVDARAGSGTIGNHSFEEWNARFSFCFLCLGAEGRKLQRTSFLQKVMWECGNFIRGKAQYHQIPCVVVFSVVVPSATRFWG
jgi:hypothetical protein